jgi:hypothetical protein
MIQHVRVINIFTYGNNHCKLISYFFKKKIEAFVEHFYYFKKDTWRKNYPYLKISKL